LVDKIGKISSKLIAESSRKDILKKSIKNGARAVITKKAITAANMIAPEHLHLVCRGAEKLSEKVKHAGAIFIGNYSPEVLGDYLAGPNHVLPTEGTARFSSPLMVSDFMKASSVINYSRVDFMKVQQHIANIARAEGLDIHQKAAEIRK
jgi:histidinol dehydrogenase